MWFIGKSLKSKYLYTGEEMEQDTQNNKKELLKIKKKYSIKYILIEKLAEVYIVFLLVIIFSAYYNQISAIVLSIFALLVIVLGMLILSKKSAAETYIIFYEDRIFYKRKFLFINKERTLKYDEVKSITFTQGVNWYQKIWQKIFNLGGIYIYPKKRKYLLKWNFFRGY